MTISPKHEALEHEAAFFEAESAPFSANGYMANLALFSTLPQRGDLVLHDAYIHASAKTVTTEAGETVGV